MLETAIVRARHLAPSVKPGISRNGNGLVEFLYPLLLQGLIQTMVERFQSPGIFKLQPELIRELGNRAFERIEVWPLKVRVVMKDGSRFEINR